MATMEQVRAALTEVMDPELNRNIVDLGMVHDLALKNGVVSFTLALTTKGCPLRVQMQDDARARLLALEGVTEVEIALREMTAAEKQAIFGKQDAEEKIHASFFNEIKQIIAVVSGKGGVGKSTIGGAAGADAAPPGPRGGPAGRRHHRAQHPQDAAHRSAPPRGRARRHHAGHDGQRASRSCPSTCCWTTPTRR